MTETRTLALINELLWLPAETEWAEFKENNTDPEMIGKRISAFANAARMLDLHYAYLLWGVRNENHAVVGTEFQPTTQRVGNQPLELWLSTRLNPSPHLSFTTIQYEDSHLVLLEIPSATSAPVEFDRIAYIRVGEASIRLSDHQQRQRTLGPSYSPMLGRPVLNSSLLPAMRSWSGWIM